MVAIQMQQPAGVPDRWQDNIQEIWPLETRCLKLLSTIMVQSFAGICHFLYVSSLDTEASTSLKPERLPIHSLRNIRYIGESVHSEKG